MPERKSKYEQTQAQTIQKSRPTHPCGTAFLTAQRICAILIVIALRRFKRIALPGLHHNAADLQRPSVQQHGIRTAGDVRIKGNPVFPDLPPAEAGRPGLHTEALRFSLGIRQKVPWHDLGFIRLVPRERAIAAFPLIGQNFCAVHKRSRPEKFDPPNGFSVRADAKHTVVHADLAAVSGSLTRAEKNALIVLMKINGRN